MKHTTFSLIITFFATLFITGVQGLRFDIPATSTPEPFCVRDFVSEGQLVVVNVNSDGSVGDGQVLNLVVRDSSGNEYRRKKDFAGDLRVGFTAPSSTSFDAVSYTHLDVYKRQGQFTFLVLVMVVRRRRRRVVWFWLAWLMFHWWSRSSI